MTGLPAVGHRRNHVPELAAGAVRSGLEEDQMRSFNPAGVAPPFATYTHGIEFDTPARFLFGAGQTGVDVEGRVGAGIEEQAQLTWQNVKAILAEAGMGIANIVQLNMLLVDRADRDGAMAVRDAELGDHRPTSTLMYVAGLANPAWRIEIDFIAVEDRQPAAAR